MIENKSAKTPADGPIAWGCQCGRAYTVTCISSKPPKQEPVLWLKTWSDGSVDVLKIKSHLFSDHELEPLYTAPPKKEWVGLTADEIEQGCKESWVTEQAWQSAVWWAEAKLKERNG